MKNRKIIHAGIILVVALMLGFFDLPAETQQKLIPFTPKAITDSKVHLGLDLQGGAQLDYKIDLRNVPEDQKKAVINGNLEIINKRVNNLGVSEPNIYTSEYGNDRHIIVEFAGITDLEEAKAKVGKVVQLEFKELKEEQEDPEIEQTTKKEAQNFLNTIKDGGDIQVLGQEEERAHSDKIQFIENNEFKYKDETPFTITEKLFTLEKGETYGEVIEDANSYMIDASGNLVQGPKTFHIIQVTDKRDYLRVTEYPREVYVSHILISHKDVENSEETRTEEEAKILAEEVLNKVKNGEDFTLLANEFSNDPGSKEKGGILEEPVIEDSGKYVKEFENASVALKKENEFSGLVKSPFGYHIIKADKITEERTETKTEPQVKYIDVVFYAKTDSWQSTGLDGRHFVRADVEFTPTMSPYVSIKFDSEGAKMFEDLTRKNIGKPIAIFVGGELISYPNVNDVISGGQAQITGQFTLEEANNLAENLNTGKIAAPITLTGQHTIGATLGQNALEMSVNAGFWGLVLVIIFMILYYRFPGLISGVALSIYTAILIFMIKIALPIELALALSFALFIVLILKIMKSRESGVEKTISTILACFVLFFIGFLLATPIVLTLAGIAGVILSIGMTVDANVLIFERIKEELTEGRSLSSAIELGFERAWNSIRDSNFASLITCAILFYFGTSIIQGFAFNLAAGILISMFTAITVTKTLLEATVNTGLSKHLWLFGKKENKERKILPVVKMRKLSYAISITLLLITIIGIPIFGLRLGLDLTGGTLMEIKFKENTNTEEILNTLKKIEPQVNEELKNPNKKTEKEITDNEDKSNNEVTNDKTIKPLASDLPTITEQTEKIDLSKTKIIPSENGFLIKTEHISADAHDILIVELEKELGELEEIRFTTVGSTVGESVQSKAIMALIIASIMIVIYVAIAFRKIPKYIGQWKFGIVAILALIHDLLIMVGVYVYLGAFLHVEVDALFITALLTVLGFSVHDTIVIFDRIREKLKFQKREETFSDVANIAINETMARSINTSFSTLLVLLTLFLFGATSIKFFVLSLIVGVLVGTYSSVFIATPLLVDWHSYIKRKK